jgi:hypothetical protein
MTATVRFEVKLERQALIDLRDQVDRLVDAVGEAETLDWQTETGPATEGELAKVKIGLLWERLGEKSRAFLKACAEFPPATEFTFEDVASKLGDSVGSARSRHRNISRALRQVEASVGAHPPVFEKRWQDNHNFYSLRPEVQAAIEALPPA